MKMSSFFENIGAFHFNNVDTQINKYDVNFVIEEYDGIESIHEAHRSW